MTTLAENENLKTLVQMVAVEINKQRPELTDKEVGDLARETVKGMLTLTAETIKELAQTQ